MIDKKIVQKLDSATNACVFPHFFEKWGPTYLS